MEEFKIKMNANILLEVTQTGMLKASHLLDELIKLPNITKIKENVILRLDNLLVDGKEITAGHYDLLTNTLILELRSD